MLTKTVKYKDFDGNERIENLQFHLSKVELIEMSLDLPDEVSETIGNDPNNIDETAAMRILETLGGKGILDFIKKLLLKSYGIKSADGRSFEKSEELSRKFSQTLAFDELIMELMSNEETAANFVNAIIPADAADKMPNVQAISTTK